MSTLRAVRNHRGFTLIELLVAVAIIGILAAIAMPLYSQMQARARVARVQSDVKNLATAVAAYSAHTGALPPSLNALTTTATSPTGLVAGPFMLSTGGPPSSAWSYAYSSAGGAYTVQASGEGYTITAP